MEIKLIHLSTDCVFSGDKGFYNSKDIPDAKDLYGISKYKGEINNSSVLTIRKSTIGFELDYKKAYWNGLLNKTVMLMDIPMRFILALLLWVRKFCYTY